MNESILLFAHPHLVYCNCVKFHQLLLSVKEESRLQEIWTDGWIEWFLYYRGYYEKNVNTPFV